MRYRVPNAATVDGDSLVYALDIDPQGTVNPESVSVTLHLPEGYSAEAPGGWSTTDGSTLQLLTSLDDSPRYVVDASKL